MQIKVNTESKVKSFADVKGGDVFVYGGMVMMKCINDGESQYRNAVNLDGGNMYELHDSSDVVPINAILQEVTERFMDASEFMTTMP